MSEDTPTSLILEEQRIRRLTTLQTLDENQDVDNKTNHALKIKSVIEDLLKSKKFRSPTPEAIDYLGKKYAFRKDKNSGETILIIHKKNTQPNYEEWVNRIHQERANRGSGVRLNDCAIDGIAAVVSIKNRNQDRDIPPVYEIGFLANDTFSIYDASEKFGSKEMDPLVFSGEGVSQDNKTEILKTVSDALANVRDAYVSRH